MYVVDSKFVLPQDVNTVQTHHVIYEIKNAVELIDHINTFNERKARLKMTFIVKKRFGKRWIR